MLKFTKQNEFGTRTFSEALPAFIVAAVWGWPERFGVLCGTRPAPQLERDQGPSVPVLGRDGEKLPAAVWTHPLQCQRHTGGTEDRSSERVIRKAKQERPPL